MASDLDHPIGGGSRIYRSSDLCGGSCWVSTDPNPSGGKLVAVREGIELHCAGETSGNGWLNFSPISYRAARLLLCGLMTDEEIRAGWQFFENMGGEC